MLLTDINLISIEVSVLKRQLSLLVAFIMAVMPALVLGAPVHAALGVNLIANPSAETVVAGQPSDWRFGGWGTNTSSLTHVIGDSHTGNASLKAEVTAYTDGDTKWVSTPVNVTAGQNYTYSDWYKASTATSLVAQYQDAAGNFS